MPIIGSSIAAAIVQMLDSGTLGIIDRLRGSADSEMLFQTVPMNGPSLAREIHDILYIEIFEALEAAVVDGRIATVKGVGRRRSVSIGHVLNDMLARRRPARLPDTIEPPAISGVLAVDDSQIADAQTTARLADLAAPYPLAPSIRTDRPVNQSQPSI